MNKYELTTEKKKKDVINAALALFTKKGFSNVSVKEIAAHAHVSQVSIYNYFGSKEALITGCVDIVLAEMVQKAEDILQKSIPFIEKINILLLDCLDSANLSFSTYFSEYALSDPALIRLLTKNINESKREIYRKFIALGKQEGVIKNTLSTETILDFMDAINNMDAKLDSDDIVTRFQHIHYLFLYGIIGK